MINVLRRFGRENQVLRRVVTPILALRCQEPREAEWLICPMYHDLRPGEEGQLAVQLRYMKSLGEFISLDDAVRLLEKRHLGGRYFCITFDDGYWGAYERAFPVLAAAGVPAAFFVVPAWIDREETQPAGAARHYMTWNACRALTARGAVVGSHSLSHVRLGTLPDAQALDQMAVSRLRIEKALGIPCNHFACPWGQPNEDYLPERDPHQAHVAGYKSFLTTINARACATTSPFRLPRIRVEPGWSARQLKYVFMR